jgi:prolipoprotein diacylglyceryltransferase
MHSILFKIPWMEFLGWVIGPVPIRRYGRMIGLGLMIGIFFALHRAKKEGVNPDRILDLGGYRGLPDSLRVDVSR